MKPFQLALAFGLIPLNCLTTTYAYTQPTEQSITASIFSKENKKSVSVKPSTETTKQQTNTATSKGKNSPSINNLLSNKKLKCAPSKPKQRPLRKCPLTTLFSPTKKQRCSTPKHTPKPLRKCPLTALSSPTKKQRCSTPKYTPRPLRKCSLTALSLPTKKPRCISPEKNPTQKPIVKKNININFQSQRAIAKRQENKKCERTTKPLVCKKTKSFQSQSAIIRRLEKSSNKEYLAKAQALKSRDQKRAVKLRKEILAKKAIQEKKRSQLCNSAKCSLTPKCVEDKRQTKQSNPVAEKQKVKKNFCGTPRSVTKRIHDKQSCPREAKAKICKKRSVRPQSVVIRKLEKSPCEHTSQRIAQIKRVKLQKIAAHRAQSMKQRLERQATMQSLKELRCPGGTPQKTLRPKNVALRRLAKKNNPTVCVQRNRPVRSLQDGEYRGCFSFIQRFNDCYDFTSLSYSKFKCALKNTTNLEYSLDISLIPQWFHPNRISRTLQPAFLAKMNEKSPLWLLYINPKLSWTLFDNEEIGSGRVDVSYIIDHFWENTGTTANLTLGTVSGISCYREKDEYLRRLTYTHTLPNQKLAISLGQYSLKDFDSVKYNHTHKGFIGLPFSKNATATYSPGSLGAYVQLEVNPSLYVQAGFQDAYNIKGNLNVSTFNKNKHNFYGLACFHPKNIFGPSKYTAIMYSTRSIPARPTQSMGWALNAEQDIGKLCIFGKFNGSTGASMPINRSYVGGFALRNPLRRHCSDLFGAAYAFNRVDPRAIQYSKIRKYEAQIEILSSIGFGPYLTISPDIQVIMHPALRPERRSGQIYSLRAALSL